jgi:hypothetical protein
MHILVIIEPGLQPVTATDIDLVVWADILDLAAELLLHNVITCNMLYSPYGTYNTSVPYIHDKKCRFRFPYTF